MVGYKRNFKLLIYIMFSIVLLCSCRGNNEETDSNILSERESNVFFDEKKFEFSKYRGVFTDVYGNLIEKDVHIQVQEIGCLKGGKVYKLEIEQIQGISEKRLLLGMFYVQNDKICKIDYTQENVDIILKEKNLPNAGVIVCQNEEIKDSLKQEQKGFHQYLQVQEDERKYCAYNNEIESGYFETYIWERDVGLKYYKSGYGAERDLVELEFIEDSK